MLAERFAKKCLKSEKFRDLFPENKRNIELRNEEKYVVKFCKFFNTCKAKTIEQTKVNH